MLNNDERIDQLFSLDIKIIQSADVFSFSADAVLLADFARLPQTGEIVDLCAGNGAVSLFMTPRTNANITAIEIQPRLADMAQRSVVLNDLQKQINVICDDLKNADQYVKKDSADVVVCNPPYFKVTQQSVKNPNQYLAIARHELKTDLKTVVKKMSDLLKTNGRGVMVHRPDRFLEICDVFRANQLEPKRVRFVYPKANKPANMVLIEATKVGKPGGLQLLPPLVIYNEQGDYLPEMKGKLYIND